MSPAVDRGDAIATDDDASRFRAELVATRDYQIVATPTLVKVLPEPLRKIIGDLSDSERVLAGLNLAPEP